MRIGGEALKSHLATYPYRIKSAFLLGIMEEIQFSNNCPRSQKAEKAQFNYSVLCDEENYPAVPLAASHATQVHVPNIHSGKMNITNSSLVYSYLAWNNPTSSFL